MWTSSGYAHDPSGRIDEVAPFTVDPFAPPYWFDSGVVDSLWDVGSPDTALTIHRAATAVAPAPQLLVLHSHNASPTARSQVVDVSVPAATPTSTTLKVAGAKRAGAELTLTASVSPAAAPGTVQFLDGQVEVASSSVVNGTATAKVRLGAGAHALSATFVPSTGEFAASTSPVVTVNVKKSSSRLAFTLSRNSGPFGSTVTATVVVSGETAAPTGTVEIREHGTLIGSGALVVDTLTGTATIALPTTLADGTHQLTATYTGSADVDPSSTQRSYRVTPPHPTQPS